MKLKELVSEKEYFCVNVKPTVKFSICVNVELQNRFSGIVTYLTVIIQGPRGGGGTEGRGLQPSPLFWKFLKSY